MNGSKISAIEYYLPNKKENNKTLKKFNPKLDIKRIYEKTGIDTRYISGEKENGLSHSLVSFSFIRDFDLVKKRYCCPRFTAFV